MNYRVFAFLVVFGLGLQTTGVLTYQTPLTRLSAPFLLTGVLAVVLGLGYATVHVWPR